MSDNEIVVTEAMRRAVYADECKIDGHLFEVVVMMGGEPASVICRRCDGTWPVRASS